MIYIFSYNAGQGSIVKEEVDCSDMTEDEIEQEYSAWLSGQVDGAFYPKEE